MPQLSGDGATNAARIFYTTNLAAAMATVTVLIITWVRYKKPDVSMTLNGSLTGLVAITAGCDTVTPVGAAFIGVIAGFAVVFGIEFVDQKLKVDDPVGAVGVHGICGCLGTILTVIAGGVTTILVMARSLVCFMAEAFISWDCRSLAW